MKYSSDCKVPDLTYFRKLSWAVPFFKKRITSDLTVYLLSEKIIRYDST